MRRVNVLVFPCGSEIGLELYRSLRFSKEVKLFGASSVPDYGRFVYERYISGIPFVAEPDFLSRINEVIEEHVIDYIFPAHDSVVLQLAEFQHNDELLCRVVASPFETCRIARSKKETMRLLGSVVRTPHVYDDIDDVTDFPVFLKPDVGQGSKGTVIVNSKEEAQFYLAHNSDLLILEYLPGAEYTVDCYTDANGDLIFCGGRQRCRISNGISVNTKPVANDGIEEIALKINERMEFRGVWFFQLKEADDGQLALMEIASRVAGSMGLYRNLGVNFALMNIYELEGCRIKALPNTFDIEMERALCSKYKLDIDYRHVYVDFDDCLLIDKRINTYMICFLYQCINEGVKIYLLTRHARDIHRALVKHRLDGVFDDVIHLKDDEKKSMYIQHGDSIFIDDSFSERMDVSLTCNIPVFSPDAIESLLK